MIQTYSLYSTRDNLNGESDEESKDDESNTALINYLRQLNIIKVQLIDKVEDKQMYTKQSIDEYCGISSILIKFAQNIDDLNSQCDLQKHFQNIGDIIVFIIQDDYCFIQFKHFFSSMFVYNNIKNAIALEDEFSHIDDNLNNLKIEQDIETVNNVNQKEIIDIIGEVDNNFSEEFKDNHEITSHSSILKAIIQKQEYKEYQPLEARKSQYSSINSFKTVSYREYNIKYVAQYSVQIENEEKFQVKQRIIGNNGQLLRHLIYNNCIKYNDCTTKIRLRGKGSGYKEGIKKEESTDPLELCVSSLNPYTFNRVCMNIEFLLNGIYFQYYYYLKTLSPKKMIYPLQIVKHKYVVNRSTSNN